MHALGVFWVRRAVAREEKGMPRVQRIGKHTKRKEQHPKRRQEEESVGSGGVDGECSEDLFPTANMSAPTFLSTTHACMTHQQDAFVLCF